METKNYQPPQPDDNDPDITDKMAWPNRVLPFIDIPKLNLYRLYGHAFTWTVETRVNMYNDSYQVHVGKACMLGTDYTVTLYEDYWSVDQSNEQFIPSIHITLGVGGLSTTWDPSLDFTYPDDDRMFEDGLLEYAVNNLKEAIEFLNLRNIDWDLWERPCINGKYMKQDEFYNELLKKPVFSAHLKESRDRHNTVTDYGDMAL